MLDSGITAVPSPLMMVQRAEAGRLTIISDCGHTSKADFRRTHRAGSCSRSSAWQDRALQPSHTTIDRACGDRRGASRVLSPRFWAVPWASRIRSAPRRIGPPPIAASSKEHISTFVKATAIPGPLDRSSPTHRALGERVVVLRSLAVCALSSIIAIRAPLVQFGKSLLVLGSPCDQAQPHAMDRNARDQL